MTGLGVFTNPTLDFSLLWSVAKKEFFVPNSEWKVRAMDDKLYFKEMKEIATGSQENNTEKQKEGRWLEQQ